MTENFVKAIMFTLKEEGVRSNDPQGGDTKWGWARKEHPEITDEQWSNWTEQDSINGYKKIYWTGQGCDTLEYPMDCAMFDCSVNPGQGEAKRLLAIATGYHDFNELRRQHYRDLVTAQPWKHIYLKDWLGRVDRLEHTFPDEVTTSEPDAD